MPSLPFPDMRLKAAELVLPIVWFPLSTSTPLPELARAVAPVTVVPK